MKHFTFLPLLLLILTTRISAQEINVLNVVKTISKGEHPAIETLIENTTVNDVVSVFDSKMKAYKGKLVPPPAGNVEYKVEGAIIPQMSDQPLDISAYFLPEGNNVRFTSFYGVGGLFFSPNNQAQYAIATDVVRSIHKQVVFNQYTSKLDIESKKLATIDGEMKLLEKEKADLEKVISKTNQTVSKENKEVSKTEQSKENTMSEIDRAKASVAKQKDELAKYDRKALENEIKALTKDQKSIQKSTNKASNDIGKKTAMIEKLKNEISNLNTLVESNTKAMNDKTTLIADKRGVINMNNLVEKEKQLKQSEKDLAKLEKEAQKAKSELQKSQEQIKSSEQGIAQSKNAIEENLRKQAEKKSAYDAQQQVISTLKETQLKFK